VKKGRNFLYQHVNRAPGINSGKNKSKKREIRREILLF
jgi:hypothetical protein